MKRQSFVAIHGSLPEARAGRVRMSRYGEKFLTSSTVCHSHNIFNVIHQIVQHNLNNQFMIPKIILFCQDQYYIMAKQ